MTAKTRADLLSQATANLADNTSGDISAQDVRDLVSDLADSAYIPATDGALGDAAYKSTGTTTGTLAAGDDSRITGALQQGKTEIWLGADRFNPQVTNGCGRSITELGTNLQPLDTADFDTSTQEFAVSWIKLPKKWNLSTLTARLHWTADSGSGGVVWAVQAAVASDGDALNPSWGTEQTVTDTFQSASQEHRTDETSAITAAGTPAAGDILMVRVKRNVSDASDTLGVDARLLGVEFFFTSNAATDA